MSTGFDSELKALPGDPSAARATLVLAVTRLALPAAVALALTLLACGGGDNGPSVRVVIDTDLSSLPPGLSADDAMDVASDVIKRRVDGSGGTVTTISREDNRLSVSLKGLTPADAGALVGRTGLLEFREPVLNRQGKITCTTPDGGAKFFASMDGISEGVNATTGAKEMQCFGAGGATGSTLDWKPAQAQDSQGQVRTLTGSFIKANGAQVETTPSLAVTLDFTSKGGLLFEQVTTRLVGYPLGIFLDEQLIGAPSVREPITGGNTVIEGLTLDEAKRRKIQLNAGALPFPVRVVSAEAVP